MKPERKQLEYERVAKDEWIPGIIEEIERDPKRDTGFPYPDKKPDGSPHPMAGQPKIIDSVRFKFKLEGYRYPHRSRWMTFSYHEKSGLYKKYLWNLVEGAAPDMDFDLEALKGMRVKTMWSANGDFDNLEMVRPDQEKIKLDAKAPELAEEIGGEEDPQIPF